MDIFNAEFMRRVRNDLVVLIKKGEFTPSVTTQLRNVLDLADDQFYFDNYSHQEWTYKTLQKKLREVMRFDFFRVFIMCMELVSHEEGKASKEKFKNEFFSNTKKGHEILKKLGNFQQYDSNFNKYRLVAHYVMAEIYHTCAHQEEQRQKHLVSDVILERSSFFFCAAEYFKGRLLKLRNKHSTVRCFFEDVEFFLPANTPTITEEDKKNVFQKLDEELLQKWTVLRSKLKKVKLHTNNYNYH
jgi:hypothetical protein